jgi:fructoselysine 6-kinase
MVRVATIGDNVVDCYEARNEMFPGGNCLNVSVFIRRFGGCSAYVGAVGRDAAGELIRRALEEEGVDVARLRMLVGPTAYCLIGHRDSDRVFLSFDLGVSMFRPTPEDITFLSGFDAVHVGQSSGLDAFLPQIAAAAPLSYDFSTRRDPEHRAAVAPRCFLASLSGGDASREEAQALAVSLAAAGARHVLVTRGKAGAILLSGGETFCAPAAPATVVDTLGAGDTFIARTLYGLLAGETPAAILAAAAQAAAVTCGYFGAVGHGAPIALDMEAYEARKA